MPSRKTRPVPEKFKDKAYTFLQLIALETDRGCVLVAAATMDELLEAIIREYITKAAAPADRSKEIKFLLVDTHAPPLGSFGVRVTFCYALRLFGKPVYDSLKTLGSLRNEFAHIAHPVELHKRDLTGFPELLAGFGTEWAGGRAMLRQWFNEVLADSEAKEFTEPRLRFMEIAAEIWAQLMGTHAFIEAGVPIERTDEGTKPAVKGNA